MFDLPGVLGTLANLAVIILGFGGIIFLHELGHFVAAKWAGIRVLAFSMGMGPVVCSYRKGIGFRKGSSEAEYRRSLNAEARGATTIEGHPARRDEISPTEYRFSALPLGGYVKMLGQEDLNPGAISDAPDSYQNRPVWKRMVVISAGVVMNLITAAVLFVIVFMAGLRVQPPVIGAVGEGSPGAQATPVGRDDVGPGLLPEDRIVTVDGSGVRSFNDVMTRVAMSGRDNAVTLGVERPGVGVVEFLAHAHEDRDTGFLDLGVVPPQTTTVASPKRASERAMLEIYARFVGLDGVPAGAALDRVAGDEARRPSALGDAAALSEGRPFDADFRTPDAGAMTVRITPERQLMIGRAAFGEKVAVLEHLLGLRGVACVSPVADPDETKQGLRPGDVFLRVGDVEFPSREELLSLVPSLRGKEVELAVLRTVNGTPEPVTLTVQVGGNGTIGFLPGDTLSTSAIVARPIPLGDAPEPGADPDAPVNPRRTPAADLIDRAGTRIVSIDGRPVGSVRDIPGVITALTDAAFQKGDAPDAVTFNVAIELPLPDQPDGSRPVETRDWTLTRAEVQSVRDLGWQMPGGGDYALLFEGETTIVKATGPLNAVSLGLSQSRQVMTQTYLTFLRLFQGTVKIQHLKGPVGIAHLGTQVADQGFIWVLFFLGLVSVNLAVINFLPLPIVDGGQFLMLAYEGIRRRPVPVGFQNTVTLAGLVLIGVVFLVVTFHDVQAIFGG